MNDDMTATERFRIGTRGSDLAQYQARRVQTRLHAEFPDLESEIVIISTEGDRDKSTSLTIIGGQGVFTKELDRAVLDGRVDCAVHSLKDLPSDTHSDLSLVAVLERDDPRDVLISPSGVGLNDLPYGARIGTSSRRRVAQIIQKRPDLEVIELRGNVDTRMSKVLDGSPENYAAAVLAAAGVMRMGWHANIAEFLPLADFVPAPGQAALGIECRADDERAREILSAVDDPIVRLTTDAERAFLRAVGGGCRSPIGAYASIENADLNGPVTVKTMFASEDLSYVSFNAIVEPASTVVEAVTELAERLLSTGGPQGYGY